MPGVSFSMLEQSCPVILRMKRRGAFMAVHRQPLDLTSKHINNNNNNDTTSTNTTANNNNATNTLWNGLLGLQVRPSELGLDHYGRILTPIDFIHRHRSNKKKILNLSGGCPWTR